MGVSCNESTNSESEVLEKGCASTASDGTSVLDVVAVARARAGCSTTARFDASELPSNLPVPLSALGLVLRVELVGSSRS